MKIKITTLAPVHIGNNNNLTRIDFYTKNSRFYRINFDSLIEDEELKNDPKINDYLRRLEDGNDIKNVLSEKILTKHILYDLPLSASCAGSVGNEVKEFIKTKNKVYIPGSSIKGAILSGVIYSVARQFNIQIPPNRDGYNEFLGKVLARVSKISTAEGNQFLQWLNVSDSTPRDSKEVLEITKASVVYRNTGKEKMGLYIYYETLKEGTSFEAELTTSITPHSKNGKRYEFGKPVETLLEYADKFYREIYGIEGKKNFIILPEISKDGYLLRLGQGSTTFSTSLIMLANKPHPKTIKLVHGKSMGWIKVKLISPIP